MSDELKRKAAQAALAEVKDGMRVGLGTGSTADHFVKLLGERVRGGLKVIAVPTSERTAQLAKAEGISVSTLEETPVLDVTIDGADELDEALTLIKGGGGALLREKIVATASREMIVIADASKRVSVLGAFPLPIEVVPFGLAATKRLVQELLVELGYAADLSLRQNGDQAFVTDGGHYILDANLKHISHARKLATSLLQVPGVVDHGLFIGIASKAYISSDAEVLCLRSNDAGD